MQILLATHKSTAQGNSNGPASARLASLRASEATFSYLQGNSLSLSCILCSAHALKKGGVHTTAINLCIEFCLEVYENAHAYITTTGRRDVKRLEQPEVEVQTMVVHAHACALRWHVTLRSSHSSHQTFRLGQVQRWPWT
jgi:hypothetical protein